jgi:hypothetical protein
MLAWLYDILVAIFSFIMGLFGCEFGKKQVTFAEGTKEEAPANVIVTPDSATSASTPEKSE